MDSYCPLPLENHMYMLHLGTWFSGDLGSVSLMAGLDLAGLCQPKLFYNSVLEEETNKLTILDTHKVQASWE